MATMEEAKAEQQEKNALAGKLAAADADVSELREKLEREVEERAKELRKHEAIVAELDCQQKLTEKRMAQALEDWRSAQGEVATLTEENNRYEEVVGQLSAEINKLRKDGREKEEIISAMLKKTNADAEERYELETELAIMQAKHLHGASEKEKLKRLIEEAARSGNRKESLKPRHSFGSRSEAGSDMIVDLQRLHDVEVKNLQSAFEDQLKELQNRVKLYQERVADLEENILLHMAPDPKRAISLSSDTDEHDKLDCADLYDSRKLIVLRDSMEAELATKQFQLSVAKALLRQYMDSDAHREQEVEKWKKLYFASKATIGMLQKDKDQAVATARIPRLQDWLELEKARYASKLEQRHWQEVDAFERQMKARDERMEAFRLQLITMEDEAQKRLNEIAVLKKRLAAATEEKMKLEELLKEKGEELGNNIASIRDDSLITGIHEKEDLQNLPGEKEQQYNSDPTRVSMKVESGLHDTECNFFVAEAKIAHLSDDGERRATEKGLPGSLKGKFAPEQFRRADSCTEMELQVQDDIYQGCLAMEVLSTNIVEAQMREAR